ncbi:MAG TPA: hypothetical protein VHC70_03690 [Phycisphaerales bacterium]|nr:hypothetical protein [Phycisphaerales bacterium]
MSAASEKKRSGRGARPLIVALNGGSSNIKFALFERRAPDIAVLRGQTERAASGGVLLRLENASDGARPSDTEIDLGVGPAGELVLGWLCDGTWGSSIAGVGHRVVHGGCRREGHERLTPDLLADLKAAVSLDRAHLPSEISLIEASERAFPGVPQVVCFDTVFHNDLPRVARVLPIPRSYDDAGVQRLGFHGLSYEYLMMELERTAGAQAASGRVVLAHLGSGASMSAVRGGRPIDTTMGFTPTGGLVMATRPGDVDPGVIAHIARAESLHADGLDDLINRRCGLAGVSGGVADMRTLLRTRASDVRASEAVDLFCRQARKWIGALATALGGLETVVFSGGIGAGSAEIRRAICDGLEFIGVGLDVERNAAGAGVISADSSRTSVRVIRTDEERMIARHVVRLLERV